MLTSRRLILAAAVSLLGTIILVKPAVAVDRIVTDVKDGVSVSRVPTSAKYGTYVVATTNRKVCNFRAINGIVLDGDYIYVKDTCPDGLTALGIFQYTVGTTGYRLRCRNPHGAGTVARCNFNWPEKGTKAFYAGFQNGRNGTITQGNATHFVGG